MLRCHRPILVYVVITIHCCKHVLLDRSHIEDSKIVAWLEQSRFCLRQVNGYIHVRRLLRVIFLSDCSVGRN